MVLVAKGGNFISSGIVFVFFFNCRNERVRWSLAGAQEELRERLGGLKAAPSSTSQLSMGGWGGGWVGGVFHN